jgi:hypothetical protein
MKARKTMATVWLTRMQKVKAPIIHHQESVRAVSSRYRSPGLRHRSKVTIAVARTSSA